MQRSLLGLLLAALAGSGCASAESGDRAPASTAPAPSGGGTAAALAGCRPAGSALPGLRVVLALPEQVGRQGTPAEVTVTNTGDAEVVLSPSAEALPIDAAGRSLVTETSSGAAGAPLRLAPGESRRLRAALSLARCDAEPTPTGLPELPDGRYDVVARVLTATGERAVSAPVPVRVGTP